MTTFGIEIEAYNISRASLAAALNAAGIQCHYEGYNHVTRDHWKIVDDSSIRGRCGFEVVSPVLEGEAGLDQVRTVCRVLVANGARINNSCGLHVHIGARHFTLSQFKNLFKYFAKFERAFDSIMPASRRESANRYCQSIMQSLGGNETTAFASIDSAPTIEALAHLFSSRYYKLNIQSFWRHGTIEFRHHSGSIDGRKVANWICFCLKFTEAATTGAPRPRKQATVVTLSDEITRLFAIVKDSRLRKYFRTRQSQLRRAA